MADVRLLPVAIRQVHIPVPFSQIHYNAGVNYVHLDIYQVKELKKVTDQALALLEQAGR